MDRAPRTARGIMTPSPYVFRPDQPIRDAAGLLVREHRSGAPVVDADGRILGVLTELDLLDALSVVGVGDAPSGTVADHMTKEPVVASAETSVYDLAARFRGTLYRRLPVVDMEGRLLGVVARHDVLGAFVKLVRELEVARGTGVPFEP